MTKLFCDIGGTHIRFTHDMPDNLLAIPRKQRVLEYANLIESIRAYIAAESIDPMTVTHFYFAFSNRNEWVTDAAHIRAILPLAKILQVNDFEANAYGIAGAKPDSFELLYKGVSNPPSQSTKVVLGVGTGLGLAYITPENYVLRTHGGHMLPPMISDEHRGLYQFIGSHKSANLAPIYEDVVSGHGLFQTYLFLCKQNHFDPEFRSIEDIIIGGLDHPVVIQALNIFHEMLGLFIHHAVAFGYAYDGVYLTGGMIDKLRMADKLNIQSIISTFHQRNVPIVVEHVMATPIYWVKDEYISLSGLQILSSSSKVIG
jgi:glucokinase